jgi:hypothetical protein
LFDRDAPIATDRNSESVRALAEAIDASPSGRKGVAIDAAIPEATLSKILSGVQGVPAGFIDALDNATLLDYMRRLGKPRGIEVRMVEASEINEQLLEAAQEMVRVIKIAATRDRPVRQTRSR